MVNLFDRANFSPDRDDFSCDCHNRRLCVFSGRHWLHASPASTPMPIFIVYSIWVGFKFLSNLNLITYGMSSTTSKLLDDCVNLESDDGFTTGTRRFLHATPMVVYHSDR
ncbi:unnamed protein product [Microthlaspi erraticum]|uniref:Uncharacterized protein n=1 Tax=Microthlaspi erraticum TaxID=1685480 RepID=A0A6D2IQ73_9BRAS|nr:unnamed protein product [Microthlaspi erraticum]